MVETGLLTLAKCGSPDFQSVLLKMPSLDRKKYLGVQRRSAVRADAAPVACVETRILALGGLGYGVFMTAANAEDVARIFPNAGDHAILEIVNCGATIAELDAAASVLQDDDEAIRDIKIEMGERLSHLVRILRDSDVLPLDRSDA